VGEGEALNRKELVDAIQQHTAVARADVDKVLGSLIQHTQVAVKKGDRVTLVGFGTFERQNRKPRTARNPRSGEPVKVKAKKVPSFRAGQGFRNVVAGKAPAPELSSFRAGPPLPGPPTVPPPKPPPRPKKSKTVSVQATSTARGRKR
jgi:DNA-binding protein HU-beta